MNLVHDVLDKQMVDSRHRRMGKVDGIVLELADGRPPRVVCLEAGISTLAHRLNRPLGRLVDRVLHRFSSDRPAGFRIPWPKVRQIELEVHIDLDAESTPVFALERWLRHHVVCHLPGGRRGIQ